MPKFQHRISARHALTPQEMAFCRIFVAMRKRHGARIEAYRRAYWPQVRDPNTKRLVDDPTAPDPRAMERAAAGLIGQAHIAEYIEELDSAPEERARAVIYEQAQVGGEKEAAKAAEMILAMEDKIGFQTDAERHAEILCAVGAEVVVPLPNGGETIFPLGAMFPQWAGARPPADAIEKTIKSLQAFLALMATQDAAAAAGDEEHGRETGTA